MMRTYLLVYNEGTWDRQAVATWANESPLIKTWRSDMSNSFYLISDSSAQAIHEALLPLKKKSSSARYLVTEIADNRQGMLLPDAWFLINNKKLKPKS